MWKKNWAKNQNGSQNGVFSKSVRKMNFVLKLIRDASLSSFNLLLAFKGWSFLILGKIWWFFWKFSFFEKLAKIQNFHHHQWFCVFCTLKTPINQISCMGDVSSGLTWTNWKYRANFWWKMFKNLTFWPKSAQYLDFGTTYGRQTNFNGFSTWKHIGIEYQILFLAFSEAEIFSIRFAGRNRARTGEIGREWQCFRPETKLFFDYLFQ